jgi:hypothetical protein
MAAKNTHLEHLEDEILNFGIDGGRAAINFLQGLRDMMKGNSNSSVNMTVKWDGAPAIICGMLPMTNRFFVAKKSLFNKTPLYYTSEQEIKDAPELKGDLQTKFLEAYRHLSKLSWNTIMQGDLMFTQSDKKTKKIDGKNYITFQPNTILYAVDMDSELGKQIASAKIGIVFHTTYSGSSIEDLSAQFGANISKLGSNRDVWMDDATYKDVSGNSTLTAKDTLKLTQVLSEVGKQFHQITRKDLDKFNEIQNEIMKKGAGATYKTYVNSLIRAGKYKPNYNDYMKHFENYWRDKVVGAVKQEKTKEIKREIGEQLYNEMRSINKMITAMARFQELIVIAKQIIIDGLNRAKSIGTFITTDTGLKTVNPEGYVAIDRTGSAVKLVDRMEFSQANFNAAKNWDK